MKHLTLWVIAAMAMASPAAAYEGIRLGKVVPIAPGPCYPHDEAQEKADTELVRFAAALIDAGKPGVVNMRADLEAAFARAPDRPPLPELCGEEVHTYTLNLEQTLGLEQYMSEHDELAHKKIVYKYGMPYAAIGYALADIRLTLKDNEGALQAVDKGQRNDPDFLNLIIMRPRVYSALGRYADAIAYIDDYIAAHGDDQLFVPAARANLLRRKGFCLGKLGRMDEAERAYTESLTYAPGNANAMESLKYLHAHKSAAPPSP